MATKLFCSFIWLCILGFGDGWRAVPANKAMYALRSADAGLEEDDLKDIADNLLPRTSLHSIYKFGYCTPQATNRKYLQTTVNISFVDKQDSLAEYLYIIADMNTQKYALQCVVMKMYTPKKFQFWKSRIPLYYCQGQLYILMMSTVHRLAIHEFYLKNKLNMAVDIHFEFYNPRFI